MKPWIVLTKIGLILDLVNIVSALWALAFVKAISGLCEGHKRHPRVGARRLPLPGGLVLQERD